MIAPSPVRRFNLLLVAIVIVIVVAAAAALLYVRALRRLARHAYYEQIAGQQAVEITVTIPEGYRREQIAALLQEKGVTAADDFLAATQNDEGRLFPDTYRFFPVSPAAKVRERLRANFTDKAETDGHINEETLIIASIVEREARNDEGRAGIAGVYWNRYRAGLALTADPTVQYGRDSNELAAQLRAASTKAARNLAIMQYEFWQPITQADYDQVESPYNTYSVAGLPPGPISNPGLASLVAAANPTEHNYYYFFHADGQIIYSRSLEEHNANKARYL